MSAPQYDIRAVHAALAALGEPDYTDNLEAVRRGAADAMWHLRSELGVVAPLPQLVWERGEELTCEGGRLITLTASHQAGLSETETGLSESVVEKAVETRAHRWWDAQVRQWAFGHAAGTHAYGVLLGNISTASALHGGVALGLDVDLRLRVRDSMSQLGRVSLEQIVRWSEQWWLDDDMPAKTHKR